MNWYIYNSAGKHVHSCHTEEEAVHWAREQYKLWRQQGAPRVALYSVHYNPSAGTPSRVIEEKPETPTPREQVFMDYSCDSNSLITNPGKFEREPIFAPYFWGLGQEGLADVDNGRTIQFRFKKGDDELVRWPELKQWLGRSRTLTMTENDQGFVHCT